MFSYWLKTDCSLLMGTPLTQCAKKVQFVLKIHKTKEAHLFLS